MAAKVLTEETEALLSEAVRQTNEINECRNRVTSLGHERREVLAALRSAGVTYKQLAEATGLHHMTIQQDLRRYRNENPKEMWQSFTKATAKSATTGEPCDTDFSDSEQAAVVASV
jgi:IS30 family transposase|tara:strand:- start:180 stop:527 length:348 start_codon:yes stop_codon:yes gene_type:complete